MIKLSGCKGHLPGLQRGHVVPGPLVYVLSDKNKERKI